VTGDTPSLTSTRFLTVFEVAAIMRLSKQTVYRLVQAGDLQATRVGRSYRIPEHAVRPEAFSFPASSTLLANPGEACHASAGSLPATA
jgi:excisionase family DNA binding protein